MPETISFATTAIEMEMIPEFGGRLHRIRAFDVDVLRTPPDAQEHGRDPFSWGCFVMAPWCNRNRCEPLTIGERSVTLEPNFSDGTAIHGQVYSTPWTAIDEGTFRVLGGGDTWPWTYEVIGRASVRDATVSLHYSLTNTSDDRMPAGLGLHPWFRRPLHVSVPARSVFPDNASTRPHPEPVAGSFDLRQPAPLVDGLDATWADLDRPSVALSWPQHRLAAAMTFSAARTYVVAASPPGVDAVAVEPQTHAPEGLRRLTRHEPGGLELLEPGAALSLVCELAFRRL